MSDGKSDITWREAHADPVYRALKWIAIAGVALWLGYEGYDHFAERAPGDMAYLSANNAFEDARYEDAAEGYRAALASNPAHLPALRGLANSEIQLKRYGEALKTIEQAMALDPAFAGHYATRGIIYDRMGRYERAMADYETALERDPELADGMHWLDRFLYNIQEPPPTIADRLRYLKQQMALPEEERVLSIPEIDDAQRPYEQ